MNYVIKICHKCNSENLIFVGMRQGVPVCTGCQTPLKYLRITNINGFVYILSNESMPGLVKIGLSARPVSERVAELNKATAVPTPFKVEAFFTCEDPKRVEQKAHQVLQACRMKNREFFSITVAEAIEVLKQITNLDPSCLNGALEIERIKLNNTYFTRKEVEESPTLQWLRNQNR